MFYAEKWERNGTDRGGHQKRGLRKAIKKENSSCDSEKGGKTTRSFMSSGDTAFFSQSHQPVNMQQHIIMTACQGCKRNIWLQTKMSDFFSVGLCKINTLHYKAQMLSLSWQHPCSFGCAWRAALTTDAQQIFLWYLLPKGGDWKLCELPHTEFRNNTEFLNLFL